MSNYSSRDSHPRMGALRAQLDSIIHRHSRAEFHVHLVIHELNSVPYLDGDYSVKWRLRGVVNPKGLNSDTPKGRKDKEREGPSIIQADNDLYRYRTEKLRNTSDSVLDSPYSASPTQSTVSLPSSSSSSGLCHTAGSSFSSHPNPTAPIGSEAELSQATHFHSHDRGMTPFKELRDHKVNFKHTVDVIVQMYIDHSPSPSHPSTADVNESKLPSASALGSKAGSGRSTPRGKLLPSPLKLVIIQKVNPDDTVSPSKPRLGAVYLDLAEFADPSLGPVTRKFLLAESRTNAILKLTIHIIPHNVPTAGFVAPPLRPATIQSPLSDLLKPHAEVEFRTHAPVFLSSLQSTHSSLSTPTSFLDDPHRRIPDLGSKNVGTRDIIDAIFNPVATSNPSPSPFTHYVGPPVRGGEGSITPTEIMPKYAHSDGSHGECLGQDIYIPVKRPPLGRAVSVRSKSSLSNEIIIPESVSEKRKAPIDIHVETCPLTHSEDGSASRGSNTGPAPMSVHAPAIRTSFSSERSHEHDLEYNYAHQMHFARLGKGKDKGKGKERAQPEPNPPHSSTSSPRQASFSSSVHSGHSGESDPAVGGKDRRWWKRLSTSHEQPRTPKRSASPIRLAR